MDALSILCRSLAVALLVAALPAWADAVTVRDDAGVVITLAQPARRIVSLAPHATELLFAAGAGDRVVGAVAHSDWPAAARALPRVGDAIALDLERIMALQPDLVVAWPYTVPAQLAPLRARGVPIFVSNPQTIVGIADDLERLGTLAGTTAAATPTAAAMRAELDALKLRHAGTARGSVFYQIWNQPLYTIGGKHLISEAIAVCGGRNIFAALTLPAPAVSVEAVVAARPDVIVAGSDDGTRPVWLDDWLRWPEIPAVRDGRLRVADGDLLHRPGPRFIKGVVELCAALAPVAGSAKR